ncbi:MAG: NFYB/HAP3 family transcription factor subunit [Nitrososphaerota archaeon]
MSELSNAPMHRILRKAGATRVSEEAVEELRKILEDIGTRIAAQSIELAQHAGRRTVKREDIEKAARIVLKSAI